MNEHRARAVPQLLDMRLFVRAMALGSLSAAGRELDVSPAVASKRLTRLERTLGVRLVQRSSRQLALTDEGAIYLERAEAILADVDEASLAVGAGQAEASGTLHVATSVDMGRQWVAPVAARFTDGHPLLRLQLSLSDGFADLLGQGVDVAVRNGVPPDSRLVARHLARNRRVVCAAPSYLERHGWPRRPEDLARHSCLVLHRPDVGPLPWTLQTAAGPRQVRVDARMAVDTGDVLRDLAVAGHGLAFKSIWDIAGDLRAGRLEAVLYDHVQARADIHAVYPSRQFLPARTRLFIETLQQHLAAHEAEVMACLDRAPQCD